MLPASGVHLPLAAGLLAASVGVALSFKRALRNFAVGFRGAFVRLAFLLSFELLDTLGPAFLGEGEDKGEEEKEHYGVDDQARNLLAGHGEKAVRGGHAHGVDEAEPDRDEYSSPLEGWRPVKILEHSS